MDERLIIHTGGQVDEYIYDWVQGRIEQVFKPEVSKISCKDMISISGFVSHIWSQSYTLLCLFFHKCLKYVKSILS